MRPQGSNSGNCRRRRTRVERTREGGQHIVEGHGSNDEGVQELYKEKLVEAKEWRRLYKLEAEIRERNVTLKEFEILMKDTSGMND